ncbi:hypothetical protein [Frankia sp. Cj3]|nr:hypothetical protein [Frankia sp. Cj3]
MLDAGSTSAEIAGEFIRRYRCELERWPHPAERRRLTPQVLALLAATYGTDVHSLLDVHDRACLRPADRLVIDSMGASSVDTCTCGLHGERKAMISAARTVPLRALPAVRSSASVQPLPVVQTNTSS